MATTSIPTTAQPEPTGSDLDQWYAFKNSFGLFFFKHLFRKKRPEIFEMFNFVFRKKILRKTMKKEFIDHFIFLFRKRIPRHAVAMAVQIVSMICSVIVIIVFFARKKR